jgi:hypothetical protein
MKEEPTLELLLVEIKKIVDVDANNRILVILNIM